MAEQLADVGETVLGLIEIVTHLTMMMVQSGALSAEEIVRQVEAMAAYQRAAGTKDPVARTLAAAYVTTAARAVLMVAQQQAAQEPRSAETTH